MLIDFDELMMQLRVVVTHQGQDLSFLEMSTMIHVSKVHAQPPQTFNSRAVFNCAGMHAVLRSADMQLLYSCLLYTSRCV